MRGGVAGHGWRLGASADGTSRHTAAAHRCVRDAVDGASPRLGLQSTSRDSIIEDDSVVGTLGTGLGSGPTKFQYPNGLAVLDGSCCLPVRFFSKLQRNIY
jgi:hypothetical protein